MKAPEFYHGKKSPTVLMQLHSVNVRLLMLCMLAAAAFAQVQTPAMRAREAIDLLLAGEYAKLTARFSPEMKQALTEEVLRTQVSGPLVALGKPQKIAEPEVTTAGTMQVTRTPVDFAQARIDIQITFNAAGEIAGMFLRPRAAPPAAAPSYVDSASFRDESLTAGHTGWPLPATLSLPNGKGPFDAVVLVHGSGAHDRDETIGPNKGNNIADRPC